MSLGEGWRACVDRAQGPPVGGEQDQSWKGLPRALAHPHSLI